MAAPRPVVTPPLRERVGDIESLATHFLQVTCSELGREPLRMTQQQLHIRELKNVIERAVISSVGNRLRLDLAMPEKASPTAASSESPSAEPGEFVTATEFKELEKANIVAALTHAGWKTWGPNGAAELLGMKPSTLA